MSDCILKSHIITSYGDELPVTVHIDHQPYEPETLECPSVEEDAIVLSVILDKTGKEIECDDDRLEGFRMEYLESRGE